MHYSYTFSAAETNTGSAQRSAGAYQRGVEIDSLWHRLSRGRLILQDMRRMSCNDIQDGKLQLEPTLQDDLRGYEIHREGIFNPLAIATGFISSI